MGRIRLSDQNTGVSSQYSVQYNADSSTDTSVLPHRSGIPHHHDIEMSVSPINYTLHVHPSVYYTMNPTLPDSLPRTIHNSPLPVKKNTPGGETGGKLRG
jgi:hypothetical protein